MLCVPDALTARQIDVLRRARDISRWYRETREEWELREAMFLCEAGLLDYVGLPRLFSLTAFGQAYLSAIEKSREASTPPGRPERRSS